MYSKALFTVFSRPVTLYGIMIGIGLLVAFGVLSVYAKKKKVDEGFVDFIFYVSVFTVLFGFASASLLQSFYNYLKNPDGGFHLGGLTFLGGFVGGAVLFLGAYFLFWKKKKTARLLDLISILPCCILVGHAFGRIGCFFAGCCYGKETTGFFSFLGVKFPGLYEKVYPTQLFESAFLFLMFAITSLLLLKKDFKYNLPVYLISYGVFRFLIEFIRGDDRGKFIGAISPSQFWSILMVLAGVGTIFLLKYLFKKRAKEMADEPKENV